MTDEMGWETLASTLAYEGSHVAVRRDRARLPDGTETDFEYVTEEESVVVLPFTPDDDVVIIEEWRQAVDRASRGLPAGGMEPGDDAPATAARRELTEETGYVADGVTPLVTVEPINGLADAVHHYVLARGCTPDGERNLDPDETIRVDTTTFPALKRAVGAGEVRDGRTALGVLYYDAFGGGDQV